MSIPTILVLLVVIVASVAVAKAATTMLQYRGQLRTEDSDSFQMARYAPMARLLDPAEVSFLAAQPGVDAQAVARFQSERRKIFRMYLKDLAADFQALHAEARELVAAAPDKNSELVENLVRLQFRFWRTLAIVECQLALDSLGVTKVDPRGLLDAVDALSSAVARATAVPGPIPVS